MRKQIKTFLHTSPPLFAVARRAELFANALFRRVHDDEFKAIASFANPMVIADVGANLGQSIATFARIFPSARFQAFEPNPACIDTIRTVARLARVKASVHACGLGSKAAELCFYVPIVGGTALLQEGSFDRNIFNHPVTIERIGAAFTLEMSQIAVRQLDDFPDDYDLLKIDAQGFELAVLRGAVATLHHKKPLVFVENGPDTPAVAKYLSRLGYREATLTSMTLNSLFIHSDQSL